MQIYENHGQNQLNERHKEMSFYSGLKQKATIFKVNMEKVVTYSFTVDVKNTAVCQHTGSST